MEKTGLEIAPLCLCGCGKTTHWNKNFNRWSTFIRGHGRWSRFKMVVPSENPPLCKCGCGNPVVWSKGGNRWNIYVKDHSRKNLEKKYRILDGGSWCLYEPDHPFSDKRGYIAEHQFLMEQKIGRYLSPEEVVHHKDENHLNNDPDNLELFSSNGDHVRHHKKGKTLSTDHKRKVSEALRGENHPMYGRRHTEETKRKISETRIKIGIETSAETRKKISDANTGQKRSDETRRKIAEARLGKSRSEETKRKISETKRRKNDERNGRLKQN